MKKLFHLVFGALVLLTGCETNPILFTGPYFVKFTEASITKKESYSKPIIVEVHNAGPALEDDALLIYKISGDARYGIDYTISGDEVGQVTIPSGEYFGYVEIHLINNANNIIRTQDLILTLESASSGLHVGQGESAIGKTFTVTIVDDCILGGDYIAKRASLSVEGITITSADCENYVVSNWNIGVFNSPFDMDLLFIDNGDNTLTIPDQEETELPEDLASITGTGVVDPITRKIILTITLLDFTGQPQVTINYDPD